MSLLNLIDCIEPPPPHCPPPTECKPDHKPTECKPPEREYDKCDKQDAKYDKGDKYDPGDKGRYDKDDCADGKEQVCKPQCKDEDPCTRPGEDDCADNVHAALCSLPVEECVDFAICKLEDCFDPCDTPCDTGGHTYDMVA